MSPVRPLALLLVTVALAGCGSSSDDATPPVESSPSKEAFVQQANAICAAARTQVEGADATQVGSIYQGVVDDVRALGAPAGESDALNRLLGELQSYANDAAANPSAAADGSLASATALDDLAAYGLTDCAAVGTSG